MALVMSGIPFHCFRGPVSTRNDGVSADQFMVIPRQALLYVLPLRASLSEFLPWGRCFEKRESAHFPSPCLI